MFGSRLGFSGVDGSNGIICGSIKCKMEDDGHLGYTKMVRFSGSAGLMVPLSITLCDPESLFQGYTIV